MISVQGLRKSYGDHVVLDGIELEVSEGEVFALLGPNGAGKTTTVEILTTYIRRDAGTVRVAGHDLDRDPAAIRASIGVTGQFSAVDPLLTAAENMRLMADLFHLPRAEGRRRTEALLERFDLADAADSPISTYSGGMRRKLDLAMTLVADPLVVFLDEPTTGLDPWSRRDMWDVVRELAARGVTLLLTTQYLEEADRLADRVALLDDGRLVAEGTPSDLKASVGDGHIELLFGELGELEATATVVGGRLDADALTLEVPGAGGVRGLRELLDALASAGVEPAGLAVHTPDLDDVFLALTGRAAAEATR